MEFKCQNAHFLHILEKGLYTGNQQVHRHSLHNMHVSILWTINQHLSTL